MGSDSPFALICARPPRSRVSRSTRGVPKVFLGIFARKLGWGHTTPEKKAWLSQIWSLRDHFSEFSLSSHLHMQRSFMPMQSMVVSAAGPARSLGASRPASTIVAAAERLRGPASLGAPASARRRSRSHPAPTGEASPPGCATGTRASHSVRGVTTTPAPADGRDVVYAGVFDSSGQCCSPCEQHEARSHPRVSARPRRPTA